MDEQTFARRRLSFGTAADTYERGRPTYPADAVAWLLGDTPSRVVDLGAGTGKLTRALLEAGHHVVAVEPDPQMRAAFARALPGVAVLEGSAESIPLDAASVDAVVSGQAWHWFDLGLALPEIARVLVRRGRLGVAWNLRDESVPWVAELGRVMHGEDGTGASGSGEDTEDFGALFSPIERQLFHHEQALDVEDLIALAGSRSHTLTLPAPERDRLLCTVEAIGRREAVSGRLVLPYVTECLRARRVD